MSILVVPSERGAKLWEMVVIACYPKGPWMSIGIEKDSERSTEIPRLGCAAFCEQALDLPRSFFTNRHPSYQKALKRAREVVRRKKLKQKKIMVFHYEDGRAGWEKVQVCPRLHTGLKRKPANKKTTALRPKKYRY